MTDLARKRGDTRRFTFTINDSSGTVVDISAWTAFLLTINPSRCPLNTDDQVVQLSGSFTTDGTDGKVYFSPAGTEAVGNYYYDAQAVDDNSEKYTFAEGAYVVSQDITKT